jgi:hypothetical protein
VSPVRYELGYYIPGDGNLHSRRREDLKSVAFREFTKAASIGTGVQRAIKPRAGSPARTGASSLTAFCVSKNLTDDSSLLMDQSERGRG